MVLLDNLKIQQVFHNSWDTYCKNHPVSNEQSKAAFSIISCKTGALGCNLSECEECGHVEVRNNSCRNRHCPNCQAVTRELWIDARQSEVIDGAYFHVVFTVPSELNPIIYANQQLLYSLLHEASSKTLLELSSDKKYLGATPAIIQVLHTWGQTLNYHPHIHCIISGAGLDSSMKLVGGGQDFLIPVRVLGAMFKGKFLDSIDRFYKENLLAFHGDYMSLKKPVEWNGFRDSLYRKDWCPYIKETFNGFGNAIDYLGRYTHRIAISNNRVTEVTDTDVTFNARDYRTGKTGPVTLTHTEFIRRFLQHILPKGFQKIRYYGLLNNRQKTRLLNIVFNIQKHRRSESRYAGMGTAERISAMFNIDIHLCPCCGSRSLFSRYRTFSGVPVATG